MSSDLRFGDLRAAHFIRESDSRYQPYGSIVSLGGVVGSAEAVSVFQTFPLFSAAAFCVPDCVLPKPRSQD